jgi:maltose-binding protein MalE
MKKVFLILLVIILAACSPAEKESEAANAETAMRTFFSALATGQYDEAINLYGGDYEILTGWNPDISPTDYVTLWQKGCEQNGLVCMEVLEVIKVIEKENGFEFTVTFKMKDGELFQFTGCCGETLPEPITEYEISVQKDGDGYKVLSMPPYVP